MRVACGMPCLDGWDLAVKTGLSDVPTAIPNRPAARGLAAESCAYHENWQLGAVHTMIKHQFRVSNAPKITIS